MALNIAVGQLQAHAGPDSRLTAQANLMGVNVSNPWFTGVWTADEAGAPVHRAWLVSGNETQPMRYGPSSGLGREEPQPEIALSFDAHGVAINGPESANPNRVELVGAASAARSGAAMTHGGVVVPGVPLNAVVPGFATERTVGRYAFWVGDQGVKASLALADRTDEVRYSPWYDATAGVGYDQRARIRQQIATVPTFFRRTGGMDDTGFDPLAAANSPWLARVLEREHFDLLTPAVATAPLSVFRREYFHTFTDRAYAVLANTLPLSSPRRGLQRDLSLDPGQLGPAFIGASNLAGYMEAPSAGNTAVPPITCYDSERRRYKLTATAVSPATAEEPAIEYTVAPELNSLFVRFKFFEDEGRLVVSSRMFVELWNPYTSGLVPEDLVLEISGLPEVQVGIGSGESATSGLVDLQRPPPDVSGNGIPAPMRVRLPVGSGAQADHKSWLPGRVYAWRTPPVSAANPADLVFYDKRINVTGWTYPATGLAAAAGAPIRIEANAPCTLVVKLMRANGELLATYASPEFPAFAVADANVIEPASSTGKNWAFGFGFRRKQPSSFNRDRDWLSVGGEDMRAAMVPASASVAFHENLDVEPSAYAGSFAVGGDDMKNYAIFRRASTETSLAALQSTRSANLDLPVFELPRLPYLSVGELQHLTLPMERPFAAGNSWGGQANTWFDRFFFSGVTAVGGGPDIAAGQPLPNWNLQPLTTSLAEAGALSSRHLLQAGGLNVNSALPEAWRAVLSAVRFSPARAFRRAAIDNSASVNSHTGSQPNPATATGSAVDEVLNDTTLASDAVANAVGGPAFFRFPQSAQETYFWANTATEGDFCKQAFRQGVRGGDQAIDGSQLHTLTTNQVADLAAAIVARLRERAAVSGPYGSMRDFLAPNPTWGGRNLLEQGIADAGLNAASISPVSPVANVGDIGFSSLTLTSGDIMTALAPYLRTRSDTFVVRAYGEAVNPVDQSIEGRAWCEAVVQRFPAPVDPDEPDVAAPSGAGFGRDFKIIQFRWLTRADI